MNEKQVDNVSAPKHNVEDKFVVGANIWDRWLIPAVAFSLTAWTIYLAFTRSNPIEPIIMTLLTIGAWSIFIKSKNVIVVDGRNLTWKRRFRKDFDFTMDDITKVYEKIKSLGHRGGTKTFMYMETKQGTTVVTHQGKDFYLSLQFHLHNTIPDRCVGFPTQTILDHYTSVQVNETPHWAKKED